jgi:hypothetical protein
VGGKRCPRRQFWPTTASCEGQPSRRLLRQARQEEGGLLDRLTREEVRDLIGYLSGPNQVPLPKQQ